MSRHHLVRVGALGRVGRFTAVDAVSYPHGARVICRTSRGLEVGEVLSSIGYDPQRWQSDGSILRGVAVEDELLLARQRNNRDDAMEACQRLLDERGSSTTLMDVEQLFDSTLYFYFLGDVSPEVERLTAELAEAYDSQVAFGRFAEAVTAGCGPGCGTEDAAGFCGADTGGCSTCAVSGACGAKA